jgi:transposase
METITANLSGTYVGLDVAQDHLDYTVDGIQSREVPNDPAGHARLLAELQTLDQPRVICAATGRREAAVCSVLLSAGIEVGAVNPDRVRAYAHSEGLWNETDTIDCRLLRRYGLEDQARLIVPTDPVARELGELIAYRQQQVAEAAATRAQLERAHSILHSLLKTKAEFSQMTIARIDALIAEKLRID